MGRTVVQITLIGLLLAMVTTLPNKDDWDIYSFHINSTVTSRYATTVITSRVVNRMDESKEIEFHVRIPKNAFISKFRMFIDGQVYDGVVKAKEQAQQQYSEAVSRGESAGLVSSVGRTLEEFKTSVTVAAHKKVTFELTYEELMKRTHGKYELQIHARPMQPVRDFKVDVYIHEDAGISFINVKGGLSTKALANAITKIHGDKQAWVHFYPTVDQQKICDSCEEQGMNGDLIIVYDVNRDNGLGHIKKSAGYFVHHFAPSSLPRIPKNVVFVIDQSGSMRGRKIQQTRTALVHILNDLAEDDHFGLITFDGNIFHWKYHLVQADSKNLESAKNFAGNVNARGSTDINQAVLQGANMLNVHNREGSASILILLTDGDPTSGEINLEKIQSNVREAIAGKFPLYCLGFGFDVNFEFLEKMSLQNDGVARRIYEESDADLQLKGFYEEVATPLLTDVMMIYVGGTNLTQTNFSQYYNGSEIVVAGQITDNDIETFAPQVVAISSKRRVIFSNPNATVESTGIVSDDRIQRVWAYLTVKQLLDKELQVSGPEKEKVKKEALELSLKYSFVTPLTSMVVTKPLGETTDVLHKPKEGETPQRWQPTRGQPLITPQRGQGYSGRFAGLSPPVHGSLPVGGALILPGLSYPVQDSSPNFARAQLPGLSPPVHGSLPVGGPLLLTDMSYPVQDSSPSFARAQLPDMSYPVQDSSPSFARAQLPDMSSPVQGSRPVSGAVLLPDMSYPVHGSSPGYARVQFSVRTPPVHGSSPGYAGAQLPGPPAAPDWVPRFSFDSAVQSVDSMSKALAPTVVHSARDDGHLRATDVAPLHRFLVKTENQTVPLCFDVRGPSYLKLFHHPSRELFVNGEVDSILNGGFSRIFIHFKIINQVEIDTSVVTVRDEQTVTHHTGENLIAAGSMTVIMRNKEIDVAVGDMRLVVLVHEKNGNKLLWPVVRQHPSASDTEGLLALEPAVYEEVQPGPVTKLKIKNQTINAYSASVTDYSIISPVTTNCWHMSAESALQRPLADFSVIQL